MTNFSPLSRRELLQRVGAGMGMLGLASVLAEDAVAETAANPLAPKPPHFKPRAKHVIHLFMNGGPSQVDTFDPKPALAKYNGQKAPADIKTERRTGNLMRSPFGFQRYGRSGIEVSELYPKVGEV